MSKKIYLIDGYGFVFRAYHSMPPLTNPAGTPVGAVYGFTNMLIKILREHKPDYMAVVYDAGRETFRHKIYPEYKANRPPAPDDLIPQFSLVRDASKALGILNLEQEGYEADDIIATLVARAKRENIEVVIVSSDKDLMQLVGDGVVMYDAMKQKNIGDNEVMEKFGVLPNRVLDVLSLMGDSSDNVPGVSGIGPKTAAELINEYGDLDNLLARAGEIKQNKRRETILENANKAKLSRELISLHYEVPLKLEFENFKTQPNEEQLLDFCRLHGFKSLAGKISENLSAQKNEERAVTQNSKISSPAVRNDTIIKDLSRLRIWLSGSIEKLAIYPLGNIGLALAKGNGECVFIKFGSGGGDLFAEGGITSAEVLGVLEPVLQSHLVLKLLHNSKSQPYKFEVFDDIAIMQYVLATGISESKLEELDSEMPALDLGNGKSKRSLQELSHEELAKFACPRAHSMVSYHDELQQGLFDKKLLTIYHRIEKPLINVIKKIEQRGAKIDINVLQRLSSEFSGKAKILEQEIFGIAGTEFNIASPIQLGEILFEKLGLAHGKKSKKTGKFSTGAGVLEDLADQGHIIAEKLLDWRQLTKLISTYTDSLQQNINSKTGRVHTTFVMTATNTGRLSSQNPNLQNIPIRSEEGRKIRAAFVAEKGNKLISVDYSQVELRLLADVANIPSLKEAFRNGHDIHAITAHQIFDIPLDAVDAEHRRRAKTINFGIIYGLSAHGLATRLKISREEAKRYIDSYFAQYPGIKEYMNRTIEFCRTHGYVETIFGRKCYIKGIHDKNYAIRNFSERAAINAPLQGSAADIIKLAMLELDKINAPMILQVHDELLFEVSEAEAENLRDKIIRVMQNAAKISVPLTVDAKIGNNWGEAH